MKCCYVKVWCIENIELVRMSDMQRDLTRTDLTLKVLVTTFDALGHF